MKEVEKEIFQIKNELQFNDIALKIFDYQQKNNPIYNKFLNQLNRPIPSNYKEIPFLPISFFKTHEIRCYSTKQIEIGFKSSGTGGNRSTHFIENLNLYQQSFESTYRSQIGNPEGHVILALLPNYVEQGESSLVYMVDYLIKKTENSLSGFYLNDPVKIIESYKLAIQQNKKVILFGVSYALLDLAVLKPNLSKAIIIETGGMKGKRKEITKEELHSKLKIGFNVNYISSEYGMSELLSQAYSDSSELFTTPPWMKILIRDTNDPLTLINNGKTGGINVIDLANLYSCSFIATQDLGRIVTDQFQWMGRFDNADIRGCNLLIE